LLAVEIDAHCTLYIMPVVLSLTLLSILVRIVVPAAFVPTAMDAGWFEPCPNTLLGRALLQQRTDAVHPPHHDEQSPTSVVEGTSYCFVGLQLGDSLGLDAKLLALDLERLAGLTFRAVREVRFFTRSHSTHFARAPPFI